MFSFNVSIHRTTFARKVLAGVSDLGGHTHVPYLSPFLPSLFPRVHWWMAGLFLFLE